MVATMIIGKIVVQRLGIARIVDRLLKHPHANAHHYRTQHLIACRFLADDSPRIHHGQRSPHAQPRNPRIPANLDELRSKAVHRVFIRIGSAAGLSFRLQRRDAPELQQILKWNPALRRLALFVDPSGSHRDARLHPHP